jgi:hypothetical protein
MRWRRRRRWVRWRDGRERRREEMERLVRERLRMGLEMGRGEVRERI